MHKERASAAKQSLLCKVINNTAINREMFRLDCVWDGAAPRAGQFFMIRPKRSGVFLGRPISAARWENAAITAADRGVAEDLTPSGGKAGAEGGGAENSALCAIQSGKAAPLTITFLVVRRGKGTNELADMRAGDEAELTGPLGNAWADFLPEKKSGKPVALVGGGVGLAPLGALAAELPAGSFVLYAGFRTGFRDTEEERALLGPAFAGADETIIATEDGTAGLRGRIPDFLQARRYSAVCACGPEPMLAAVAAQCRAAGTPCFVSLERRMACGVGACLGCTVQTANGNRRCCADGPIFNAEAVIF
jgi:NAD(P)H-flavin reductase